MPTNCRTRGDLLSGELGRELDALPAEADVAVPADQPVDLDNERGLRPVGHGGVAGSGPAIRPPRCTSAFRSAAVNWEV
ncbi:hypothetical protein [Streptomyces sp. x-19]|uniref:hypothetical protein n=1 Tax=Streptomyces sp. x-19 TaxID=2789280 RepID=UPI0039807E27